jgi:hypothetical protein
VKRLSLIGCLNPFSLNSPGNLSKKGSLNPGSLNVCTLFPGSDGMINSCSMIVILSPGSINQYSFILVSRSLYCSMAGNNGSKFSNPAVEQLCLLLRCGKRSSSSGGSGGGGGNSSGIGGLHSGSNLRGDIINQNRGYVTSIKKLSENI